MNLAGMRIVFARQIPVLDALADFELNRSAPCAHHRQFWPLYGGRDRKSRGQKSAIRDQSGIAMSFITHSPPPPPGVHRITVSTAGPLLRARAKWFAAKTAFFSGAAGMNRIGRAESGTTVCARQLHTCAHFHYSNAHEPCTKEHKLSTNLHKLALAAQNCTGGMVEKTRIQRMGWSNSPSRPLNAPVRRASMPPPILHARRTAPTRFDRGCPSSP